MKKLLLFIFILFTLGACQKKSCRCYLLTRYGNVHIVETYIDKSTPCQDLGYSTINVNDSSYRYCTEIDEPELDTMAIVHMFWN